MDTLKDVIHKCGHTEDVQLRYRIKGPRRGLRIWYMQTRLCQACYNAERNAAKDALLPLIELHAMPKLVGGSHSQREWANRNRAICIDAAIKWYPKQSQYELEELIAVLRAITSTSTWIDRIYDPVDQQMLTNALHEGRFQQICAVTSGRLHEPHMRAAFDAAAAMRPTGREHIRIDRIVGSQEVSDDDCF